jgi:hypothetical protein
MTNCVKLNLHFIAFVCYEIDNLSVIIKIFIFSSNGIFISGLLVARTVEIYAPNETHEGGQKNPSRKNKKNVKSSGRIKVISVRIRKRTQK